MKREMRVNREQERVNRIRDLYSQILACGNDGEIRLFFGHLPKTRILPPFPDNLCQRVKRFFGRAAGKEGSKSSNPLLTLFPQ